MNTMTIGKKLSAGFSLLEFSTMNRAAIGFTDSILPAVVRTISLIEPIHAVSTH